MARVSFSNYCCQYKNITSKGARRGDYPCFYCGVTAQSIDHFIPQAFEKSLRSFMEINGITKKELDKLRATQEFIPSCLECNRLASAGLFETPDEKKSFIKAKLRKRYHTLLAMPTWDKEEIAELDYTLKTFITGSLSNQGLLEQRLRW